jgi:hypothetical protein
MDAGRELPSDPFAGAPARARLADDPRRSPRLALGGCDHEVEPVLEPEALLGHPARSKRLDDLAPDCILLRRPDELRNPRRSDHRPAELLLAGELVCQLRSNVLVGVSPAAVTIPSRLLEIHLELVDEVERELAKPRRAPA